MKVLTDYNAACDLVLNAPDLQTAIEDYAALVRAFRANGDLLIDGRRRDDLDSRNFLGWTPFDQGAEYLVILLRTAMAHGIEPDDLADIFEEVRPDNLYQALCVLEDVIVITDRVPTGVDSEELPF